MHSVAVRNHMMIAHSFDGELFGPAQALHGATYVVDVEFRSSALTREGVVVDIGRASDALARVLGEINYKNLDDLPEFERQNTTTEYLARWVFDRMTQHLRAGTLGPGGDRVESMRVTLHESHVGWAAFEAPLHPPES